MAVVDVETIAACLGRPAAKADWLGPKVVGHPALLCIHQMNQENSGNGCAVVTAL